MQRTFFLSFIFACLAFALGAAASSGDSRWRFSSIDGGEIDLADWAGRPVLVVNTASLCGFTPQFDGLQTLYDRYRDRGLVVFAVPSDDFRQELATETEVKEFCELNYDLDMPMAEITAVRGGAAHPFYRWLREAHGVQPRWNFNKVLIGPDGAFVAHWGSRVRPGSAEIAGAVEALLPE